MEKQWYYLNNSFLVVTRTSFKKALKLSNYHDAMLKKALTDNPSDPDWATLYNRYHPVHLEFVNAYTTWQMEGGIQEGETLNVDQLLTLLIGKVNRWDAQVQIEFAKKTPGYKAIFPNGHTPFIVGSIDTRITAVKTLGTTLNLYPALAATKAEVDDFYTLLDDARDIQEGAKGGKLEYSSQVEQKRIAIMTAQYRNLGFLIDKWPDNPGAIAPFFELLIMRNHRQVIFTGTLEVGETEAVLIHTFVADDELTFEIKDLANPASTGTVSVYLASTPGGIDSTPVIVNANAAKLKFNAAQFGITDFGIHRYITVVNNSAMELHYEVELL